MDDSPATLPLLPETPSAGPLPQTDRLPRWFALFQVLLIWVLPTQVLVATALVLGAGMNAFQGDGYSLEFFAMMSLLDTALVALLIRLFLALSGETSRDVFVGPRPVTGEIARGLILVPVLLIGATLVVLAIRTVVPWLHNVDKNPLEAFMRTPFEAAIFAVVLVLAGGIREELQRAFILHRFDQSLGGMRLGLVLFSVTFGLMHYDQGLDAALAVGLLGVFWGVLYVTRRSAVMAMANHAGFNVAQVLQQVLGRALGA